METKPTADFVPNVTTTYDLGSTSLKWEDLHLNGNGLIGGTLGVTGVLTASGGVDGVLGGVTPAAATVTTLTASGDFTYDSIVQPKVKIIDIGDWDMDADVGVAVAHSLTLANIRQISALIRNDANTEYLDLMYDYNATTANGYWTVDGTNVNLFRRTGGVFDGTGTDSTSYNRGWITITYV